MRHVVVAAVLAAAGAGSLAAQEPRPITLAEALGLATQAQPVMVQARQDLRVADAQTRQALAAFLPGVNATASTSKSGGSRINQFGVPTSVATYYSSSVGLSASWDVFTGLRRGAQRAAARATGDQREATLLRQEYATVLATKEAFFEALAAAELVGVQQTRLRRADEQLRLTAERLRLGATTRSDSLRARVEYGNAQVALIQAQNTLRTSQANLSRQLQVEGLVTPRADSMLFARLGALDTAALMREALERAPSVREAEAAVAAARAQVRSNRSSYLPTLSISGSYSWAAGLPPGGGLDGTLDPFSGRYAAGWTLRFSATYPLFNNLTRETNVISADASLRSAEARARDARLQVSSSLIQYFAALEAAAARIDVSTVSVAAAEEDLRMQRERYRLGAVTIIEVLASQANLDQALVDLVQARYDYLVARAQVEAIVGHSL
jgi:outer membrane protein